MKQDLAPDDFARRRLHQPHNRQRGDAFAAARLADNAQRFAFFNGKRNVIDCFDNTVFGVKIGFQPFDFNKLLQI